MSEYNVLDSLLARIDAEALAAECHGFICGQISATGTADDAIWQEFLDAQSEDDSLVRICYEEVAQLVTETVEQMHSAEYGLQLLLPGDEASMAVRVEGLVSWCHGFLNGFGVSEGINQAAISAECEEVLEDYTQICRLGLESEDADDEQSLVELIEYTRMGAIMIFEELQPLRDQSEVLH